MIVPSAGNARGSGARPRASCAAATAKVGIPRSTCFRRRMTWLVRTSKFTLPAMTSSVPPKRFGRPSPSASVAATTRFGVRVLARISALSSAASVCWAKTKSYAIALTPASRSRSIISACSERGRGGRTSSSSSVWASTPTSTTSGEGARSPRIAKRASTAARSVASSSPVQYVTSPSSVAIAPTARSRTLRRRWRRPDTVARKGTVRACARRRHGSPRSSSRWWRSPCPGRRTPSTRRASPTARSRRVRARSPASPATAAPPPRRG
jgi:hypothetical protein